MRSCANWGCAAGPRVSDFLTRLTEQARRQPCRLVLPEAGDARVLAAAARAGLSGIADCLLLGEADAVHGAAAAAGLTLPAEVRILSPRSADYIQPLRQLRQARGKPVSEDQAQAMLANPVAVAAMLIHSGQADALLAGAVTASADVLRPALQLLGLQAGMTLASSAFLMCFADGVKVFADCALNIAPDAAQLADIAIQSADTARAFGLSPVVAMLSYVSHEADADSPAARVAAATEMVRQRLPAGMVTGPIQYDAAVNPEVARIKRPNDEAAGRANVLIFPDIHAGNIAYKAVQHAGGMVSIGPLMQGLAAVANDLSRGATADDIYYTIAATAIQAAQRQD